MKTFKLCIWVYILMAVFFVESSVAKLIVRVDDAFYTSAILKNVPVDRDGVTGALREACDGTSEFCQVPLKADDKFNLSHPGMDLHVSFHCEDNGEKTETSNKIAKKNAGLIVLACPSLIKSPTMWDSVTSFAGSLLKSLSYSSNKPTATPAEAAPLIGAHHQKED